MNNNNESSLSEINTGMESTTTKPAKPHSDKTFWEVVGIDYKFFIVVGIILILFIIIPVLLQDQFKAVGDVILSTVGIPGVMIAIFCIDGFIIFPMVPDVFIPLLEAGGIDILIASVICATASYIGGVAGHFFGKYFGHLKWVRKRLAKWEKTGEILFQKHGVMSLMIGALTPIPFNTVCWLSGIFNTPSKYVPLVLLVRFPRFILLWWGIDELMKLFPKT